MTVNERIRELALQAGCLDDPNRHLFLLGEDHLEWFAKLIVQECARIARATPCPYEENEVRQRLGHTWDMASLEAGHEIAKHFGVE